MVLFLLMEYVMFVMATAALDITFLGDQSKSYLFTAKCVDLYNTLTFKKSVSTF